MDRLTAMQVFVQVVELGSFAKASERLGISTSACSRQVSDLETHLGTRLLNRTTRKLSLTETGQVFFERSLQLLSDFEEAEQLASQSGSVLRGTLRLTCPVNFGARHVAPAVAEFMGLHPQVKFDMSVSDRVVDLVEDGYDLAVRVGQPGSANLVARKLGQTQTLLCASPGYIARHGLPKSPQDLLRHNCFIYTNVPRPGQWRFTDRHGKEQVVRIAGAVRTNNGDMLAAIAVRDGGIVYEPDFIVDGDIRAGRLVQLLPGYQGGTADIWAVYPSRRHLSAKVSAFVDFLTGKFQPLQQPGRTSRVKSPA